jgi:hypothetical protein
MPVPPVDRTPLPPLVDGPARIAPGERLVLGAQAPVVVLNRVQSGIGVLSFEVLGPGPCRPALAWAVGGPVSGIADGPTSGIAGGPAASAGTCGVLTTERQWAIWQRVPLASHGVERATIELGAIGVLRRFAVFLRGGPGGGAPGGGIPGGGALVATTLGGARIEVPLPEQRWIGTVAVLTGHVVHGALVMRAEFDQQPIGLREAVRAYGYTGIGWRDADTPLTG